MNLVEPDLLIESRPVDPEDLRRPALVPIDALKDEGDVLRLDLRERSERTRIVVATELRGKVLRVDRPPVRHQHPFLDAIPELAAVAGPVIGEEKLASARGELDRAAPLAAMARQEVMREGKDVLASLPKRRKLDLEAFQPVVEVLAEAASLRLLGEQLVRRRDDAQIDALSFRPSEAVDHS